MSEPIVKIEKILKSEYSTEGFVSLVTEIFDSIKIISPDKKNKEYSNFNSHIETYSHIGSYTSPDGKKIAIFEVQLKAANYVENARSTQRSYARKLIENGNVDSAVIAFFTPGDSKWRLSFVRLDYEMKFEGGKFKTQENLTPAKRYSFLVGKDEPCHTAISRFHNFIIDKNYNPTLDEIEEAFSVEKVTKEFFDFYCEKFYQLQEYLESNDDFKDESEKCGFTSEQFAKKLMGQIVFLYFLQKKGWLGVNVWSPTLTEKEYKNVFFTTGAHGRIIREHLPKIYILKDDGLYHLNSRALDEISDDAEEVVANHMPRNKTWGDGSKNFLRTIYTYSQSHKKHFYEEYLEPLFYDALNRNRGAMGYFPALHCRVPFLSGGLFDPIDNYDWKNNYFDIPDELFSNKKSDNDREADGILDIFDRYNFTMSEDEPMEREVAIDPEMLGKVFENLLEVKDRKSKGAFYTPREIVHYMCQESLINYLVRKTGLKEKDIRDFIMYGDFMKDEDTTKEKREGNGGMYISEEMFKIDANGRIVVNRLTEIDEALANVKVADPAVGSGAFPLGMMNEIVRARQNITAYMSIGMNAYNKRMLYQNERSPYILKYNTIKNCLYAVDIEPSAVDIAQLRLWLSLVIDDEINPKAQNELEGHRDPLPLPNLECNILCGNSLIDEFKGVKLVRESVILNSQENYQVNMGQEDYEIVLIKLLEEQDLLFRCDDPIKKLKHKEAIQSYKDMIVSQEVINNTGFMEDYHEAVAMSSKPFIVWELDFARVFRDNGGFDIVVGNPPYIQLQRTINEETGAKLGDLYSNCKFETFAKTGDIYCLFYEKGYNLLRSDGVLTFITSNKWMRAGYGEKLRSFFANKTNPVRLIDFGSQKVFESATVDVNVISFTKGKNQRHTLACTIKEDCTSNLSVYIDHNSVVATFVDGKSWAILSSAENTIRNKIEKVGVPLKQWGLRINRGILTGFNEAFIISTEKKNELIASDPKSAELIRPILRGKDIKRYQYSFANLWLLNVHNGIKNKNIKPINIDEYPAIKEHLNKYYDELVKRADKGDTPYNLRNCVYMNEFFKQKIVYREISEAMDACLVEPGFMLNNKCYLITGDHLIYILSFLNSKLFTKIVLPQANITGGKGEGFLSEIKLLPPTDEVENELFRLYTQRESDRTVDDIIERIFCSMYGLTNEETRFIIE